MRPKLLYLNIHGLTIENLQSEKKYLENFDVIMLAETFVEVKNFGKLEKYLPSTCKWVWMAAERERRLGRAKAGMLMGVAKHCKTGETFLDHRNTIIGTEVRWGKTDFLLYGVYNRSSVRAVKTALLVLLDSQKHRKIIILSDWNARTGRLGGDGRESQDDVVDSEGRALVNMAEEFGYEILNGQVNGDWIGGITHVDYRSQSVIDYAMANQEAKEHIAELKIGEKVCSDHFPLQVTLSDFVQREAPGTTVRWRPNYRAEAMQLYRQRLAAIEIPPATPWKDAANIIRETVPKYKIRQSTNTKPWWNQDCYRKRKAMELHLSQARTSNS